MVPHRFLEKLILSLLFVLLFSRTAYANPNNIRPSVESAPVLAMTSNGMDAGTAGSAQERPVEKTPYTLTNLESITNRILARELAMLRLNSYFFMENDRISKWEPWRTFLYRLGAAGTSHAGAIVAMSAQWHAYNDPHTVNHAALKDGAILLITGSCIAIGGACTEMLLDMVKESHVSKKNINSAAALKRFAELRNSIEQDIAQRDAIIQELNNLSPRQKQIIEYDGVVLKDICDLGTEEFALAYKRISRSVIVRETANVLTIESSATNGFLGSLNVLLAGTDHHPHEVGTGGIGYLIAGTSVMATPIILKHMSTLSDRHASRKIGATLGRQYGTSLGTFTSDRQKLQNSIDAASSSEKGMFVGLPGREKTYGKIETFVQDMVTPDLPSTKKWDKAYKERLLFSTLVGGSNVARGVCSVLAGYHYAHDPKRFFELSAIGNTIYTAGSGIWIFDTLQGRIREELKQRQLSHIKALPERKIRERIETLEELEDLMQVF